MIRLRAFLARLVSLGRARQLDARLDEEMKAHLERATDDYIARGMTPEEARFAALRDFGGVVRTKEAWRDVRGLPGLEAVWQDLRYAGRSYRRTPGFAIVALMTLTLAIGANTAIFSLLNALVLRDLPVRDPGSLVQVATSTRTSSESYLTFPMFQELASRQQVFAAVMGTSGTPVMSVDTGTAMTKGLVWAATGNLYAELGLAPAAGRLMVAEDMGIDPPSAAPVVVLGYSYWQRHFHGDAAAIGRTLRIEGAPFTIVGVAPIGFTGFGLTAEPDLTVPLTATPLLNGRPVASLAASVSPSVRVMGRLRPGLTIEQARAQLTTAWPAILEAAVPPDYTGARRDDFLAPRLAISPGAKGNETRLRSQFTRPLAIVMSIAGLILVIACVNLASLMLSRAAARSHEIGVRLALGASRWRVARQMLTEGVLLSVAGGACGVVFAYWACGAITAMIFEEYLVAVAFDGTPDARVIAITSGVAVAVGVLFSLAPVWRVTRQESAGALRHGTRTASGTGRAGKLLISAQVALSLVLVTNAGLLVRSLAQVRAIKSGVQRTDGVYVAYPGSARPGAYEKLDNDSYYPEVIRRLSAVPGVHRASVSLLKPASGSGGFDELVSPVGEPAILTRGVASTRSPVSPGFFDAVGIPLVKGRDFGWGDGSRGPGVTIISQSLARRLFGDGEAIGQHVKVGLHPDRQDMEVVGIAADARLYDPKNPNLFAAYTAALQDPSVNFKCFVVRGTDVSFRALKSAVEALGHEDVRSMVTLRYITDRALLQERMTAMLSGFFGALALLLAGIGLFGLMSYAVAQRRREIGIRMALGAEPRRVMTEVVHDGLTVTLIGVAAGFVAALAAVQLVESLLFGITPHDPLTLLTAPATLILIAVVACLLPAARAAKVDPMIALRSE